jgi:hypothetical protein
MRQAARAVLQFFRLHRKFRQTLFKNRTADDHFADDANQIVEFIH